MQRNKTTMNTYANDNPWHPTVQNQKMLPATAAVNQLTTMMQMQPQGTVTSRLRRQDQSMRSSLDSALIHRGNCAQRQQQTAFGTSDLFASLQEPTADGRSCSRRASFPTITWGFDSTDNMNVCGDEDMMMDASAPCPQTMNSRDRNQPIPSSGSRTLLPAGWTMQKPTWKLHG